MTTDHGALHDDARTRITRKKLLVEARALLTPRVHDSSDEWELARIRWHRLDGNDALADKLLTDANDRRRSFDKEPWDA